MRAQLWHRPDPVAATTEEYQAYDSLPPALRRYLRESTKDISARKVRSAFVREGGMADEAHAVQRVLERLSKWADK